MRTSLSGPEKKKRAKLRPRRIPVLALRPDEAAAALGISRSLLGEWTKAGLIPFVRRGGVVMYGIDGLRKWLTEQEKRATPTGGQGDERA